MCDLDFPIQKKRFIRNFSHNLEVSLWGKLPLEEYDILDIIKILVAANKLNIQELVSYLQSSLIENYTNGMEQNFTLIYRTSFENDSFLELQKYCNDLMSKEPDRIFNSLSFTSIPENILISLIQNENLQMNEVQVWEHALKWGHAQNQELSTDPTNLSKNDFYILKDTLRQLKDSDEILGGYNPITWNSNINSYGVTNNSFLFSFKNNDNLEDHILSRIKDGNFAIFNNPNYGPSFDGEKQNYLESLNDNEYCDITIEVGNDPNNNDENLVHIKLPNILPDIFQTILRYIYGGRLPLEEHDANDIIKILVAANELSLQELVNYLQSFLIEKYANWLGQNFNMIYQTLFENDSFLELQKFCTDLISKEPDKIFNSMDFSLISEKILITLIQNDNFQMGEVHVWEHVLKWGHAQNPGIPSDPTNFSKDDFNIL
ncbi:BTB/POZ protein [Rhizophagus irregularis DAOM 181602=DAOM 197198]|nr:BTB/POZ protein [Rhizophagus irregularis DAOM 181602=DAOM 197198]